MLDRRHELRIGLTLGVTALTAALGISAAPAADFYAGKTIEFVIGSAVGGGYDIYARAIGRHLPRFIPGSPTIVPKNQPGAGSGRAASFVYSIAPKDGTVIGAVFPGVIIAPLFEDRAQPLFDPTKFQYLGSADSSTRVCITSEKSKVKTFEDAQRQKTIMGASAAGASTRDYTNMHRKSAGALFEMVSGYKGSADMVLAMERGEIDGLCGYDWSSLKSQRPDWVRNRTVNILVQVSLEPDPELTRLGVPQIWKYIKSDEDRKAVELIVGQQVFGRPYLAPPGVLAEQVKTLRNAFTATLQDKEFLAEAEKLRVNVEPTSGEKVQQLVEKTYAAPKATVERAKELIRP
jgi:tripartite-type tricarboxylate transporter receptor subunit TctC